MTNSDQQLSQLISKSLRHELNGQEAAEVEKHMAENEQARQFAEISQVIQNSIRYQAENSLENSSGLSPEARQRMKDSLQLVLSPPGEGAGAGPKPTETRLDTHEDSKLLTSGRVSEERELTSRFHLLRLLNKGGLGSVWLARDKKLNRTLAIKEMHRESLESPQAWQRFRREAEITGHLEHPNVVPIYQFGEDRKTGEPFYAMRFVGKRTLSDAILEYHDRMKAGESSAMATHRLLSVFLDVCQAIAYAHSRGVIHRDLKPDNVALDNFGQVVVLDWGLAKVLEDGELANKMTSNVDLQDSRFNQTMQGDVVGTPLYMAPEQAAGELDQIDERTDVYGLGAILFAILCGNAPHEQSVDSGGEDLKGILKSIAYSETPKASEYLANVPRDLETICCKAMARKPHMRFGTVTELAEAVESWMAGQHGKQASYDNMRMEGRELRTDLQTAVRDLERNVRFMSALPPIQELINVSPDDVNVWRERLAQIFRGLLRANPNYRNVVYSQVEDGQFTELVRVERHSTDASSLRIVPRSRLRTGPVSIHMDSLLNQQPDEVLSSLVCDPMCERDQKCEGEVRLAVGVPVYDEKTEDVFGVVMITCDIDQVLRKQMSRRSSAAEIVVACDTFQTMMHWREGQIVEDSQSEPVADIANHFLPAIEALQKQSDFIDESNADIYGARLWLIPNEHGLMYLLRRKE